MVEQEKKIAVPAGKSNGNVSVEFPNPDIEGKKPSPNASSDTMPAHLRLHLTTTG